MVVFGNVFTYLAPSAHLQLRETVGRRIAAGIPQEGREYNLLFLALT